MRQYLTKPQLAEVLNLTVRGVECLIARRAIPFIRLSGRCVRFDLERVREALDGFEVRASK